MKPPSIAASYACLYPGLAEIAQRHGYALAIHGSVVTDLDLVAVPWTESAAAPEVVAEAIRAHADACLTVGCTGGNPEQKSHGRLAWHLSLDFGAVIDLSVMPRHRVGGGGAEHGGENRQSNHGAKPLNGPAERRGGASV